MLSNYKIKLLDIIFLLDHKPKKYLLCRYKPHRRRNLFRELSKRVSGRCFLNEVRTFFDENPEI